ncbi:unnamed protein product [Aspergillus oryzae]|nr:unnamed protein product [Aspergillus oryzae]
MEELSPSVAHNYSVNSADKITVAQPSDQPVIIGRVVVVYIPPGFLVSNMKFGDTIHHLSRATGGKSHPIHLATYPPGLMILGGSSISSIIYNPIWSIAEGAKPLVP